MSDYLHGAYGQIQAVGTRVADSSQSAVVYVGTAPVQTVEGGANNVNVPVVVNNIAEARKLFGYSEDWASYTLCEAMHVHLENGGVGPLILINVLDPRVHKAASQTSKNLTPNNGRVIITNAENIYMDSVTVKSGSGEGTVVKVKGTDYSIAYNGAQDPVAFSEMEDELVGLLQSEEDPTFSIFSDESVPIGEIVQVMNIAKRNHYKVILATQPE